MIDNIGEEIDSPTPQFQLPKTDLLDTYKNDVEPIVDEVEVNNFKEHIKEIFRTHNIPITGIRIDIGSAIIRYVVITIANIKATFVKNVARAMETSFHINIRTSIPAQGVIYYEVPISSPGIVSLRSLLESEEFTKTDMELPITLGKTISNEVLVADLTKIPHLIVAGLCWEETTCAQYAVINSLLYKKRPDKLKFILIDTRILDFNLYVSIASHYLAALDGEPIITDIDKAIKTIKSINTLMERRYELLRAVYSPNIKDYNKRFKKGKLNPADGHHYMPYIVVVINDYADLALTAGKDIGRPLIQTAQLARAVGIHIVIATHRSDFSFLNGFIKAKFPGRIAFNVSTPDESKNILDHPGAEMLVGRGDMLFLNGSTPVRAQCVYIDEQEVEKICQHIAQQPILSTPFKLPEPGDDKKDAIEPDDSNLDPLFEKATQFIVQTQVASTSMLQRQFSIGYNRVGQLMDQLEAVGIVGPSQGAQPRNVYVAGEEELKEIIEQLKAKGDLS